MCAWTTLRIMRIMNSNNNQYLFSSFIYSKTRQVMDIPSTDPGSDFFDISTDEEFLYGDTDCHNTRFSNRLKVRSTDASLKSIATYCESTTFMPPELIVTSAKDSDTFVIESADKNQNIIREFPPLNKRTRSWHNLNRCMSRTR
jgi:hypothetical protein